MPIRPHLWYEKTSRGDYQPEPEFFACVIVRTKPNLNSRAKNYCLTILPMQSAFAMNWGRAQAPCAAMCSSSELLFLWFSKRSVFGREKLESTLAQIENRMNEAATRAKHYETAAIYRDCLQHLSWLDRSDFPGCGLPKVIERSLGNRMPARKRVGWMILRGGRIISTMLQPNSTGRSGG